MSTPPPPKPAPDPGSAPGDDASSLARAEKIFFEVVGLSPADRSAAIARLAGDDEALRRRVVRLLDSASQIGGFLEQPALGKAFDDLERETGEGRPDDLLGATLGAFRLERRIDSGGMGTVYLAQRVDEQFDQRVAIKVVKRGMDSEEILRRFREERQTLAQLDHPYIARMLDGGVTPDGRPYLVMEYVDGLPIDQYCDTRRLSTTDRLRLFRLVCEGVHAAHQSLVIHRDLKPANILVTPAGTPKLLDFGIAKVLSGTRPGAPTHTAETDRRLTPEYASPEQISGAAITTASDVYSLGVVLYELLTGVRPYAFTQRSTEELRRVVCELTPRAPSDSVPTRLSTRRPTTAPPSAEPAVDHPRTRGVSASRLRSQLRGDLDTIVLMALRKEPSRRYASAEQMGADIGRYLSGLPVTARRDTWLYRSRKFVRRNLPAVIAAGLAVALLAGGLAVRSRQKAQIERQRDELVVTNQRLSDTREFLVSMLSGAQTSGRGPSATLGEVLDDAARALETDPPADPMTLAGTQQAVGSALMTLGRADRARPLLESAAAALATLPADSPARLEVESELAQLKYYEGKAMEAEAPLRDLLARERARAGGSPSAREGDLLNALGAVLRVTRRIDEALAVQQDALRVRTVVHGEGSLPVAESRNNIATIHMNAGRYAEAAGEFRVALDIRAGKLRADHPLVLATAMNLGVALLRTDDVAGALPHLDRAAQGWEKAYGADHPGQVSALTALAQALVQSGRAQEAVEPLRRARAWQEARPDAAPAARLATRVNLAIALAQFEDCAAAAAAMDEARADPAWASLSAGLLKQALQAEVALSERCGDANRSARAREDLKRLEDARAKPSSGAPAPPR